MNKFKRVLTAGVLACALTVGAANAATVTVRGTSLPASAGTILINDRTYVPLRAVAQLMDPAAQVSWKDGTATVTTDRMTLTATVGQKWLSANGREYHLPDGVKLIGNKVMVHIRPLAEAMGGSVSWDAQSRSVSVTAGTGGADVPAAPSSPAYREEDLYWLACIISAESRGEPMEGKLAVGTVVLNRVASSQFPDSIYGVIFDRQWGVQFTPVANGTIYDTPTAESVEAARRCLEGERVAGDSLYFLNPAQSTNFWVMNNRPYVTTIGSHRFYA